MLKMLQKFFPIISHVNSRFQFIRTFLKQKVSASHMTLQDKKNHLAYLLL